MGLGRPGLGRPGLLLWCVAAALLFLAAFHSMNAGETWTSALAQYHGRLSLRQHVDMAEKIWAKTVKQRHQALDAWEPKGQGMPYFPWKENMEVAKKKMSPFSIWDMIPPSYSCPYEVERVGRFADGGKWVCGMSLYENMPPERPCVIYSFGINDESSFEEEMLSRTKCEIWGYDFSVDRFGPPITENHLRRAHFSKIGLGEHTDTKKDPPFYTLADLMKKNGHDYIDILKIDVEWAEFKALGRFASDFSAVKGEFPIGQMLIEIHLHLDGTMNGTDFIKWWEVLEDRGMRPTWWELNLLSATLGGPPQFCEYVMINAKDRRNVLFKGVHH